MNAFPELEKIPVLTPLTLSEALDQLKSIRVRPTLLAGGTDVMVQMEAGVLKPDSVLDLSRVSELKGIRKEDAGLWIGALATYTEIVGDPSVPEILKEASLSVGADQIQNRGTIGGNIANASPAGDTLPVLLALNAEIELASVRGTRKVSADSFFIGYRKTAMAGDELITRVRIPKIAENARLTFRKVGTRAAQAISKVVFAGHMEVEKKCVRNVRLAFGSVAPTPVRARSAEKTLEGLPLNPSRIDAAVSALSADLHPIDDVRSTAQYRIWVAKNCLAQYLSSMK